MRGRRAGISLVRLDKLRWRYAINIEGQLAVTQALLPMIRKARSRIIMIGPVGDRFTTEPSGQWA